jgi:uncharacterized iron-regulated membrane protein
MNKQFLKNITEAHSWLGLIISGLLFVVFFAGSISLFRAEITQWSMQPHFAFNQGEFLPLSEVMPIAIKDLPFDAKEHLSFVMPTQSIPYYQAYVDVIHQPGEVDYQAFYIDAITGEKLTSIDSFFLSDFIYELHMNLNLPAGQYVVGLVTLLFFFGLVSGVLIHAKKLIGNFFKYRASQQGRSKLLDMHNVIGVMSLPYTLMFALSGLIFNLSIIYQIVFAVVLYQGDQQALLDDAGYQAVEPKWQDIPLPNPKVDMLYQQVTNQYGYPPEFVRIYNYGDQGAVFHVFANSPLSLSKEYEVAFTLQDNKAFLVKDQVEPNRLVQGLHVMAMLHFGHYAGFDLRLLYFILGMGVCALIISGNLLWLEKRSRMRNQSVKTLRFISHFTLWSTAGIILSTAMAFLVERLLPATWADRSDFMVASFIITLVLVALSLFFNQDKKRYLAGSLTLSAYLLLAVIVADWLLFAKEIIELSQQGVFSIVGTEIGLFIIALSFLFTAKKLLANVPAHVPVNEKQYEQEEQFSV